MRDVGIESVYLPLYSLALGELAVARGVDPQKYRLGFGGEPTQGAGAVAMVISDVPRQMTVDFRRSGSFAEGVFDFWPPLDRHEAMRAGVNDLASGPPEGFQGRFYCAGTDRHRRRYLPVAG